MASDAYELLALLMRYVFVIIGFLVLFRAYRWMRRDARNYRREMRSLPDAGLVGEIVDLRSGKSQPLPREGDMGASRECDIFVKGAGIMRHHLRFAFEEGKGVLITPSRLGKTWMGGQPLRSPGYALHGTQLQLGDAVLRVRLFAGLKVPAPRAFQPDEAVDAGDQRPGDSPLPYGGDWEEENEDAYLSPGPDVPAPFEFPNQPAEAAPDAWQQPLPGEAPPVYGQPPMDAQQMAGDYEGHYTEDGQMTWKYAYSLQELYQAQAAMRQQPAALDETEENDEALPYQSPVARRRRRRGR